MSGTGPEDIRVALITGSYPPDICGVGDYTHALAHSLNRYGLSVEVLRENDWRPSKWLKIVRRITKQRPGVIPHIQYPTVGYGWSVGPQVLSLAVPMVCTIHEASQVHPLRKLSIFPFTLRSQRIIFTTEFERSYVARFLPWVTNRSCTIPIGSNIAPTNRVQKAAAPVITYFGLIRPRKGLENVIHLAKLLKRRGTGCRVRIIGTPALGCESYYAKLKEDSRGLPVEWVIGLDAHDAGAELARAGVAYLPFPDGASERRGSLISMLMNGVAVVTSEGRHTPAEMKRAVILSDSVEDAAVSLERLIGDEFYRGTLQEGALEYARRFEWESIAARHIEVYRQLSGIGASQEY